MLVILHLVGDHYCLVFRSDRLIRLACVKYLFRLAGPSVHSPSAGAIVRLAGQISRHSRNRRHRQLLEVEKLSVAAYGLRFLERFGILLQSLDDAATCKDGTFPRLFGKRRSLCVVFWSPDFDVLWIDHVVHLTARYSDGLRVQLRYEQLRRDCGKLIEPVEGRFEGLCR